MTPEGRCGLLRAAMLAILLTGCVSATPTGERGEAVPATLASAAPDADLAARFDAIMQRHAIPGAQLVHNHAGTAHEYDFGVMRAGDGRPVTPDTLFQAASLSKVVGAYIALRLVDQGRLDLDTPLWDYWPSPRTRDNPQARRVTARMVLNHTTGLENWQISPSNPAIDDTPLKSRFPAGERYAYSGEGFYLLQRTMEHITGQRLEALAKAEVFVPFDMPDSRYMSDPAIAARNASGHGRDGAARAGRVFGWENTAWTLVTSAREYDRFVQHALFRGKGLTAASHALMLATSSDADDRDVPVPVDPYVSWGLGVGLQTVAGHVRAWHWGDNPGFKAFFMLDLRSGDSVVLFTNSENGLASYKDVLRLFLGDGEYPAVDWARSQS